MPPIKFSSKSSCTYFFKGVVNDGSQPTDYFRCKFTSFRPVHRQETRCSSTFKMVSRFFELRQRNWITGHSYYYF
ncbi:hypothetical protein PHYPSEUDO_014923 [Phytophthora pseudosyringae]|uniref:Uncharacterized protein n=1 Tax=Phytophthora pseudosyringae TaxID=221518 RepID=A0A8T1W4U0_9STRA|nr:hypothetical protein PHYPSEUDO_014923 [Phytophthora pseudosyringae]